jgi:hypothetical protein
MFRHGHPCPSRMRNEPICSDAPSEFVAI